MKKAPGVNLGDRQPGQGSEERPLAAIGLVLLSLMLFSGMDAISKTLVVDYSPVEIAWVRFAVNLVLLIPFAARFSGVPLRTANLGVQIGRGIAMMSSSILFMSGLAYLPMADATAIAFASPLMVIALSIPILREHVGTRRWAAVTVGLLGVLLIVRPGSSAFQWAAIYPFLSAACFALGLVLTRRLGAREPAITTLLYTTGVACIGMTAMLPLVWKPMTIGASALAAVLGVLSAIGQYLLLIGYQRAPASLLAPFSYSQIIWSTFWGALLFNTLPSVYTGAGAAIVVASGLYVFHRERVIRGSAKIPIAVAGKDPLP